MVGPSAAALGVEAACWVAAAILVASITLQLSEEKPELSFAQREQGLAKRHRDA